jgi:hypothetical protein
VHHSASEPKVLPRASVENCEYGLLYTAVTFPVMPSRYDSATEKAFVESSKRSSKISADA